MKRKPKQKRKTKIIQKKRKKNNVLLYNIIDKTFAVILLIAVFGLCFPQYSLAQNYLPEENKIIPASDLEIVGTLTMINQSPVVIKKEPLRLPENGGREAWLVKKMWVTAYNSLPEQTDFEPCIAASGLDLCEHDREDIIATNFLNLPFGTRVKLPELFGDRVFVVHDRMNASIQATIDVWLKDYQQAKKFGRKWTTVEIY